MRALTSATFSPDSVHDAPPSTLFLNPLLVPTKMRFELPGATANGLARVTIPTSTLIQFLPASELLYSAEFIETVRKIFNIKPQ